MNEYANVSTRAGRALSAACILLGGTVPLGIALLAALAAGLSDNPDATGPGGGAFVLAFGVILACTALAARVALEPALRCDLGWWCLARRCSRSCRSTRRSPSLRCSSSEATSTGSSLSRSSSSAVRDMSTSGRPAHGGSGAGGRPQSTHQPEQPGALDPELTCAQAAHGPRRQRCPTSRNPCYARHEIDTNPRECPCYPLRPEWEKRSS